MRGSSFKNLFISKRNLLAHTVLAPEEDVSFIQIPIHSPPLNSSSSVQLEINIPHTHDSNGAESSPTSPPRGERPPWNGSPSSSSDSKKSSPAARKSPLNSSILHGATRKGFVRREADENGFDTARWNEMPPRTPRSPLAKFAMLRWVSGGSKAEKPDPPADAALWGDAHATPVPQVRVLGPPTGTFEKDYEAVEVLHQDSQRSVSLCLHRSTGELRSCRTILKQSLFAKSDIEALQGEIQVLRLLGSNPHIAQLHGVYEDDYSVRLITEYCAGRPVVERILQDESWTERMAQHMMRAIMEFVHHCHDTMYMHRNVRLSAFLLEDPRGPIIKALDFTSTMFICPGEVISEKVGTPLYNAPEVWDEKYGMPCDIWSAGVCLHILLSGRAPFLADTVAGMQERARIEELDLTRPEWDGVSPAAKDLVQKMLSKDPSARPNAQNVLDHPWIKEVAPATSLSSIVFPALRDLLSLSRFHQETLSALGETLSEKDCAELSRLLAERDHANAGCASFQTVHDCISRLARPEVDSRMGPLMRMIGAQVDLEERGRVDYVALMRATKRAVRQRWHAQLATAMRRADLDHSQLIPAYLVWEVCKDVGVMDVPEVAAALVDTRLSQGEFIESESFLAAIYAANDELEHAEFGILTL